MMRLSEFLQEGITAATISRMEQRGALLQLSRGLYQLPDAPLDAHHSLAEAAKLIPNGIICLSSALAYHDLTDKIRLPPGSPSALANGVLKLPDRVSRSCATARSFSTRAMPRT